MPEFRFNVLNEKDVESASHKFENFDWPSIDYELPIGDNQYSLLDDVREGWRDRLYALSCEGHIHKSEHLEKIRDFCQFLIDHQRDLPSRNIRGVWCIPQDPVMPNDASVDFLQLPTRIAVSILVLVLVEQPALALSIKGYERALKKGLKFIARYRLTGHGYDSNPTLVESIELLALGGVFAFTQINAEYCPVFNQMVERTKGRLDRLQPIESGNECWGALHDWKIEEAKRQLATCAKPHDIMRNYEQKKSRFHRDIEFFFLYSAFTIALGDFLNQAKLIAAYSKPCAAAVYCAESDIVVKDQRFDISSIMTVTFLLRYDDALTSSERCLGTEVVNKYWEQLHSKKMFTIGSFDLGGNHFNVIFRCRQLNDFGVLEGDIYLACPDRASLTGLEKVDAVQSFIARKEIL